MLSILDVLKRKAWASVVVHQDARITILWTRRLPGSSSSFDLFATSILRHMVDVAHILNV
jgi:hypothetical protein